MFDDREDLALKQKGLAGELSRGIQAEAGIKYAWVKHSIKNKDLSFVRHCQCNT